MKHLFAEILLGVATAVASPSIAEVPQVQHESSTTQKHAQIQLTDKSTPEPQENVVPTRVVGVWIMKIVYDEPRTMRFDSGVVEVRSKVITIKIDKDGNLVHKLAYFEDSDATQPVANGSYRLPGTVKLSSPDSEGKYPFVYKKNPFWSDDPPFRSGTFSVSDAGYKLTIKDASRSSVLILSKVKNSPE